MISYQSSGAWCMWWLEPYAEKGTVGGSELWMEYGRRDRGDLVEWRVEESFPEQRCVWKGPAVLRTGT